MGLIAVLDFGSQYTQLIARRVREIGVYCEIHPHDLDEAVYLSDRILVLRANPGEIDEFIEVPIPRPRNPEDFLSTELLATKKRLEELIHPPSQSNEQETLPITKMTQFGDEVE